MSIWTHVLGVIRYDSSVLNVSPKPVNATQIFNVEMHSVWEAYKKELPYGSEGPLQIEITKTSRGPTILVTGDLRDFKKDDLKSIINWLNQSHEDVMHTIRGFFAVQNWGMFFLRDCHIRCNVEGDDNFYIIEEEYVTDKENPHYEFKLITLENKEL